jgi:integrase
MGWRLYKRGATYWVDLRAGGRRTRHSTETSVRAEAEREARRRWKLVEHLDEPLASGPTLRSVLDAWVRDHVALLESPHSRQSATATAESLKRHLGPLGKEPVLDLRQLQVDRFAAALRDSGLARSTVAKHLRHLRAAVRWATAHGILPRAPGWNVTPRKVVTVPVVLSPAEVRAVIAAAKDERVRLAMLLAATCGLRHGELLRLRVRDVRDDGRTLLVHEAKWDSGRSVPVPEVAAVALREYLGGCRRSAEWPLLGQLRRPARPMVRLTRSVRAAFDAAGLGRRDLKPGLHALRRACATHQLAAGADIRTVMANLGWRNLVTPMLYLGAQDRLRRDAAERLADALGLG